MISSQQLGERLAQQRKQAGLTQADVAQRLSLARTTLVSIEKGERRAGEDELVRLADILGVRVHDLLREIVVPVQTSPRFRVGAAARRDLPQIDAAVARLQRFGSLYAELEQLHGIARVPASLEAIHTYRLPAVKGLDARLLGDDAALTVRSVLGVGDEPLRDLEERLEAEAGLRIFFLGDMPASLSAIFVWGDAIGACVAVNACHPRERQRWSLAHELGHFLRDREAGDVLDREEGFRSTDPSEVFAQTLAATLLMPAAGLAKRFAERSRTNGGRFSSFDLLDLARTYEVSFAAMALRLEEVKLLPAGTYDRLVESRLRPRDLARMAGVAHSAAPPRKRLPRRYAELALWAYEQELISEGRLAEFLDTDRTTARERYREYIENAAVDEKHRLDSDARGEDLRATA